MALYGLCVYLALLTHYFAALVILGQCLHALLRLRGPGLRRWAATLTLALIAFAFTWGSTLVAQIGFILDQPWLQEESPDHVWRTLLRLGDLPIRLLIHCPAFTRDLLRSALGLALVVICVWMVHRARRGRALLFTCWFAVPATAFFIHDLTTGKQLLSHLRYPAVAVPGIVGLLVLALAELRPFLRVSAIAVLLGAMLYRIELPAVANPNARVAVEQLRAVAQDGDLHVFDAIGWPRSWTPHFFAPVAFYYRDLRGPVLLLRDPPDAPLKDGIAAYPRIIVISPRVENLPPNPSPETHRLARSSEYIHQIGWIYLFIKTGTSGGMNKQRDSHRVRWPSAARPCPRRGSSAISCPRL